MRDDHSFYFGEHPHVVANVEMHSAVAIPLQSKHSFCTTFAAVVAVEVHLFSSTSNVLPTPLYFPIFVEEIFNIFSRTDIQISSSENTGHFRRQHSLTSRLVST